MILRHAPGDRANARASSRNRDARGQARDGLEDEVVAPRPRVLAELRGVHGQPDLPLGWPRRIWRQHPDDTDRHAPYPQIAIEHVGHTAQRALPQAIADDGDGRALHIVIGRLEGPANDGADTEDIEERLTNLRGLDALGHSRAARDVDRGPVPYRDVSEDVALLAP